LYPCQNTTPHSIGRHLPNIDHGLQVGVEGINPRDIGRRFSRPRFFAAADFAAALPRIAVSFGNSEARRRVRSPMLACSSPHDSNLVECGDLPNLKMKHLAAHAFNLIASAMNEE
jgi:hypothetical protein